MIKIKMIGGDLIMDENKENPQQQKNTTPIFIILTLLVIAIIGGVFWFTNSKNKNAQTTTSQTEAGITTQPTNETTETPSENTVIEEITVEGGNFYFKPNEIKVKKGEKVTITLTSAGGAHNFIIDEFNVKSKTIGSGSTTVEFTPGKVGTFEFYCGIGNHRQMGMKGSLIVE